ncbi:TIGR04282 family arsenosugar biosynthesis glycosyltransferase [Clostridium algidicarnis]|uniref:TIGR04282 family arsenosugar biosynthesis glycosyltransferase n=1 Tax=Clostridium algidicarnis TaxID=37659 RepID=UPI001C0B46D6|nr:TIGR04282 family arsenosugar biosynthesis glycosyltransferase [Clostridium algidicarnis]MBU3197091.1 TIGR04282 family arsenosugar biosynthesis glycosyltransferase [Clostridium algidicarnis]MBU3227026.1 TIGR04282 family arsenosugar biosynthesis glycosyltransferase [Clostridium algidicarnis]MBU3250552.1 TIGR04282 family arsenosugar biosynthesis glycosyltransferase [Clostridium algidicarnis]
MKEAVIIFTRVPLPGETKTRLEDTLTKNQCAKLHECFLKDIYSILKDIKKDIFIFYTPIGKEELLKSILGEGINFYPQRGNNLGERMYNAISLILEMGYKSCLLVGSDIPEIKKEYLEEGFHLLENNNIVLGPTIDGGYYMVGMKKPHKEVFEKITYGQGNVIENTLNNARASFLKCGIAKTCSDIDTGEDLKGLISKIYNKEELFCYNTIDFLKDFKLNGEDCEEITDDRA